MPGETKGHKALIERQFDVPFVAGMALREKQIQQNYRPIIAVHKWFARRPGTLFRSLLLSEFVDHPLQQSYFKPNQLKGITIADPFMGGGIPLLEANRLGCDVMGYDINPMAYWIVRQEIEYLDLKKYREAARSIVSGLEERIGPLYRTTCLLCGSEVANVKYFLWVKTQACRRCGKEVRLFPGFVVSEDRRHPKNVFLCAACGELTETSDRSNPGQCGSCRASLSRSAVARRNRFKCPHCETENSYPASGMGPPRHSMFAIEYHCPVCKPVHQGRFFKKPDSGDLGKYSLAEDVWAAMASTFVPTEEIPRGDETDRLHRWGYRHYKEMFNSRQLLGLDLSCRAIMKEADVPVRNALATNLSDLLRYQNMLCRYDTAALKSLDIFSVHGFPIGLVQCESNLLGIANKGLGINIGSGGWSNIVDKYARAKAYCQNPFEVEYRGGRKVQVQVPGEWIGDHRNGTGDPESRGVTLSCESTTSVSIPQSSLDAVLTDPPYLGNVQYAELMDFCYVWLRRLVGESSPAFQSASTRNPNELTANVTMDRGLTHFTQGLSSVFTRMAKALKPGAPLMFTYHHNTLEAYYPVAVSILDAALTCSASLPCPAEMSASIHINRTGSSIVDTIFVCRSTGRVPRQWIANTLQGLAALVANDIDNLRSGGVVPTRGDIRCIVFGHLTRLAVWRLRVPWDRSCSTTEKLSSVAAEIRDIATLHEIERLLGDEVSSALRVRYARVREEKVGYESVGDEIPF